MNCQRDPWRDHHEELDHHETHLRLDSIAERAVHCLMTP
jgi:hypothetical protein